MSDIKVQIRNIGGISGDFDATLKQGKLNLVKGSSASGKSSLVRGIHLALVGGITNEGSLALTEEIENLHLNDPSSEGYGMVHSGTSSAKATVSDGATTFSASLSSSGIVRGSGNDMKAVYTSMLSASPASILHQAVMEGTNGDDFSWVVEDLSDAKNYLQWANTFHRVKQEILGNKSMFEKWQRDIKKADEQINQLEAEEKKLQVRAKELGKGGTAELEKAQDEQEKNQRLLKAASGSCATSKADYDEMRRQTEASRVGIERAKAARNNAQRKIDDIEDLLEDDLVRPDTRKLDADLEKLKMEKATNAGQDGEAWKISKIIDALSKSKVTGEGREDVEAWKKFAQDNLGDDAEMRRISEELSVLEKELARLLKEFADKRSMYATSEQNLREFKRERDGAKQEISDLKAERPYQDTAMADREAKYKADNAAMEDAKEKKVYWDQEVDRLSDNPELDEVNTRLNAISTELNTIRESMKSTFPIRYDSLGMIGSDTIHMNEEEAIAHFSGIDNSDVCIDDIVENNINASDNERQSFLEEMLRKGTLSESINATMDYVNSKADEHRQKARQIFNEVGSTIFSTLSFSPMEKMTLDDSYELKIMWRGNRGVTGLTGSGGERTIIAAAMLIAMRAAYTPNIPVLMFDGVMSNLNDKSRKQLEKFLDGYAATNNVAIVATTYSDSSSMSLETL